MIDRTILEDKSFYSRPMSKVEFILYLHSIAIYKPQYREFKGVQVWLEKGDVAISLRVLQKETGVNKDTCKRWLKLLEKRDTIFIKSETPVTIISVCLLRDTPIPVRQPRDIRETVTETQPNKALKSKDQKPYVELKKKPAKSNLHKEQAKELLKFLNSLTGRNFRPVATTLKPIICRLKEGVSFQQCKTLIAYMHNQWGEKPEMERYLRPSTLFRPSKFEDYLSQCTILEDTSCEEKPNV